MGQAMIFPSSGNFLDGDCGVFSLKKNFMELFIVFWKIKDPEISRPLKVTFGCMLVRPYLCTF